MLEIWQVSKRVKNLLYIAGICITTFHRQRIGGDYKNIFNPEGI